MNCLYAPWRSHYTSSTGNAKQETANPGDCPFCHQLHQTDDAQNFVLRRFSHVGVMFNRYPYNAGHLLVMPLEHIAHLEHMSLQARTQMMEVTSLCTTILQKQARPDGFNIGLNLGKASGASIPAHLHMHILPRWNGDTNFLPTLGATKVISFDLVKIYQDLQPLFNEVVL